MRHERVSFRVRCTSRISRFLHSFRRSAEASYCIPVPTLGLTGKDEGQSMIAGSPDRRIAGSPDRRIAGSPDRRIAGSPDRRIAQPAYASRDRSRPLASPPEPSASAGRRSDTRQPASSSDSFDLSPARAAAGSRAATRRLRRGLFSALLALPLLLGLAAGAQAQAPGVTSIERQSPTAQYTNADSLTWRVTFSEPVRNVNAMDFSNTPSEFSGTTSLAVSSVSTSVYDITASGSAIENANNTIQLVFASGHDIEDLSGNALPASPTVSGTNDNFFQLDNTAPTVVSIERQSPTTAMTDADRLTWRVTFDDASGGYIPSVDAADFQVTGTTATITSVSEHATSIFDVTASGGNLKSLTGPVTLTIRNDHDIMDDSGNELASTIPTGNNNNRFNLANAPELVSIKKHAQEVRNLGTSLVWRVEFDKHLPNVYASDFTLSGTTAGLDVRHDLSNYDPVTYKTVVFVYAQGGDLDTVSGDVRLSFASNHNIVDFEGRRLASTTPTGANQHTFTLNPNQTLVYFSQPDYYVNEGEDAVVTVKLSRLRDTATTISAFSATPLTATGTGVDYHGTTFRVTIPARRSSATFNVRTTTKGGEEPEETFRLDLHDGILPAGFVSANAPGSPTTHTYITILDKETADYHANRKPGLVFDNAHLTWNEADGCTNKTDGTGPGPFYHVKLEKKPLGPVEVWIKDPDDDYRSDYVAKGRLYVANANHPYWEYTHTKLYFTPGNWDQYQRVNVKIKCADHYTAQIPIVHRLYTDYTGDKGQPSHAYPGYSGVLEQTWSVHVKVHESDPPIVIKGLKEGQTIVMDEGGHQDFEITLSEAAFKHDSSLTVYLSARGGKAAGVKRRDGRAQSCGGPLDDCLIFTPSNRTQWVRLFAIGPGRDELKVEIPQLRWGGLEHVRDWEMRWPVKVEHAGICGRTKAVRDEIVRKISGVSSCANVTDEHLAAIVGNASSNNLNLSNKGLSSLKAGDFDGLTNLKRLRLDGNSLTTLPAGIFDDLARLWVLDLDSNQLTTLRPGVFDSLTKLRILYLNGNNLSSLPDGVFKNNLELATLWLHGSNPGAPFRPTADAGADQTVTAGATVTLSGTATGPWASSDHFWQWRQVDGPNSNTVVQGGVKEDGATASFTAPATPTVLHLRLAAIPKILVVTRPNASGGTTTGGGLNRGNEKGYAWVTITVGGGQGSPQQDERAQAVSAEEPSCVSDALLADAQLAATETWRTSGHVERWSRVLAAFGESNAWSSNPMTIAEAQAQANRGLKRWALVAPALECLANPPQEEQPEQAEVQPVTPTTPELSLRAGSAVDEGGNATFTVTADPAPSADLTVTWTVAQSGEYLDTPSAGSRTVTLTAGTTSTALSVGTVDDDTDEADGSVSVTLGAGTGYTIATGKSSAAVAVRDNDEPVIRIVAGTGVTEGSPASFTLTASPVPAAPLDITLSVAQSGDFAASGETGSRTLTVPTSGSMTVEVATVDDGVDEPDGSITATLGTGTGYTRAAAPDHEATVAVSDNDATTPSAGPTISIADATLNENERNGWFTVRLSKATDQDVRFAYATRESTPVSATANRDYSHVPRAWRIGSRIRAGETFTEIRIGIRDDSHDENPETFEVELFDAFMYRSGQKVPVSITDDVAVGTIVNDDPMPAAWLSRFGRTVAEQALDGISGRLSAPRTAGTEGTFGGISLQPRDSGDGDSGHSDQSDPLDPFSEFSQLNQSDPFSPFNPSGPVLHGFGIDGIDTNEGVDGMAPPGIRTMTLQELLLGSHFTATGPGDSSGGSLALWGRAAHSSFDGREGTFSLDGEATTALLGTDYARGQWLVGLALLQSGGEGGYRDTETGSRAASQLCTDADHDMDPQTREVLCGGAVREGDGTVESSLTAAVPYGAIRVSERLKLWGALGYGTGEVTLKPEVGGSLRSDLTWTMASAGLRGDVIAPPAQGSGPALAITSDALWSRTESDRTSELAASDSDVTRLRLGLEGSWRIATEGGGHVTPKVELGLRRDGGDAESGSGVEVGGGIAWVDPSLGLSLDLSGRTLITHEADDLEDRGFAASLAFDPDPASERGLSLALRQEMGGQAEGGLDALFRADPLEDRTGSGETAARWTVEAAYGFPALGGRFTGSPHAGFGFMGDGRDVTVGWRLSRVSSGVPDLSFGVRATRRESMGTAPAHAAGFEMTVRW